MLLVTLSPSSLDRIHMSSSPTHGGSPAEVPESSRPGQHLYLLRGCPLSQRITAHFHFPGPAATPLILSRKVAPERRMEQYLLLADYIRRANVVLLLQKDHACMICRRIYHDGL